MAVPFTQQDGAAASYCRQVEEEEGFVSAPQERLWTATGVAATMRAASGRIN